MFGDQDLPAFFADFGVPVAFNGVTKRGIFDQPAQVKLADMGFGGVETQAPLVRLPYNAFSPMPKERDTISVAGTQYTVSGVNAEGDGAVVAYDLKAVSL